MKRTMFAALALAALAGGALFSGIPSAVRAQDETRSAPQDQRAVFHVDNMTCAACPITVRTAMRRVAGVRSVEVDFDSKRATVVYDPSRATPAQIAAASRNAGYPARQVSGAAQ